MVQKNLNCLLKTREILKEAKSRIHLTSLLNEFPIKLKNIEPKKFADENKKKFCDRLYVWGYAGVGALG